jgi:competence protein ComEC
MERYRFHSCLVFFLLGVGVQTVASFSLATITWFFIIAGALLFLIQKESKGEQFKQYLFPVLLLVLFSVGLLRVEVASWSTGSPTLDALIGQPVTLEGVVVKEPDVREQTQNLDVAIGGDIIRVSTDKFIPISYGDMVRVSGEVELPTSFTTELGREFRYDNYLLAKGISHTVSFAEVAVVSQGHGNGFVSALLLIKQTLLDGIGTVLGEPAAGLGAGLLLGVKQALGDELEQAFRTSGIIHIVVLSGYNIMLVVAFIMYVLSFFFSQRIRIIVGLLAVIGFALMVGLSATVVRASVMAGLLLIAQALGRTYDVMRALLFAGSIMVFLNPYLLLYDIGFQLSFMATLGLVLIVPRFEAMLASKTAAVTVREYLLATIATQIAVLPLLLYYIGEVSLVAVAVNLLVLPVVSLAMLTTFIAGSIAIVSPSIAAPFAFVAHYALSYIIVVAQWFAALPFAAITVPAFHPVYVFVLYGFLIAGYLLLVRRKREVQLDDAWVIEDEEEVKEKVGGSRSEPPTTPIFFR